MRDLASAPDVAPAPAAPPALLRSSRGPEPSTSGRSGGGRRLATLVAVLLLVTLMAVPTAFLGGSSARATGPTAAPGSLGVVGVSAGAVRPVTPDAVAPPEAGRSPIHPALPASNGPS